MDVYIYLYYNYTILVIYHYNYVLTMVIPIRFIYHPIPIVVPLVISYTSDNYTILYHFFIRLDHLAALHQSVRRCWAPSAHRSRPGRRRGPPRNSRRRRALELTASPWKKMVSSPKSVVIWCDLTKRNCGLNPFLNQRKFWFHQQKWWFDDQKLWFNEQIGI